MSPLSQNRITILLTEYLDGVLNGADRTMVDNLIAEDSTIRKEFEELKKLRGLLSDQITVESNPAFWTRLSSSLEQHEAEENLLPFPRRYFPTATLASAVGVLLIGLVVFQNRMSLLHFMTQKSQMVQSVYEQGILKGSILPLLSHIDNNQVLQFSLLGVLPLEKNSDLALRVDQNATNGYQIKLDRTPVTKKSKPLTVKDFYAEIQATKEQEDVIDSLCGLARRRLEGSVLVSENNAVAIDPELAQLNKVMVSNIASCLEPFQRVRFGRFLEKRDAPYTFVSRKFVPANPDSIYGEMNRRPTSQRFVVFTEDTVTFAHVNADIIRQVQRNAEVSLQMEGVIRENFAMTERLLRRCAERELHPQDLTQVGSQPFEIWKDANSVGIQFQRDDSEPRWEIQQPVVVPMPRRMRTYTMSSPTGRVEIGFYSDSVTPRETMIDSAMVRFFDQNNPAAYNLRIMDSVFSTMSARFQMRPGSFPFDSLFRTLENASRKAFEEGRHNQHLLQEEVRLGKKDPSSNER